jgi:phage repressor protein C with HTH and peptisase S24 domain
VEASMCDGVPMPFYSALKRAPQELFHVQQRYNAVASKRDLGQVPRMSVDRRKALHNFIKSQKLKPTPWAKAAGVRESTLRDYLSGRNTTMTLETLDRLAAAAEATVAEMIGEKTLEAKPRKDVLPIKSLEVRASMGGGFEVVDEPEGSPFFFRRQWVEKMLDGKPAQLRVITSLGGDSMLPTINDGDMGLVRVAGEHAAFQSGAIYAIWDGQGLIVKRLETMVGERARLRVISDNRAIYEPYEVDAEEVRIIGQVIWRGGRL